MIETYDEVKTNENINKDYIEIGVGLSLVDNIKPSEYFNEVVNNSKTYTELENKVNQYYKDKKLTPKETSEKECDLVSINIAKYLETNGFSLSPATLLSIHKTIFKNAFPQLLEKQVGVFRKVNISKLEDVLGGKKSVEYADFNDLKATIDYDFSIEKEKKYNLMNKEEQVLNIAKFISGIWQIHPFREGNTRTIAVFTIKYLRNKGFNSNNDIFKTNSKYFRDALVLANYESLQDKIYRDFSYLESFFNKFILNKKIELKPLPKPKLNKSITIKQEQKSTKNYGLSR
ncbi:Fic family protein [Campylobacter canadensis]|nr:Fic family protein [Campylobacter canadensis]MBZ7996438.1 Fic family protein [Campylobacter canadensis]MBZ7999810.1 Fic family protein [Campylobacter canadensis]MBZ8001709.1 Fic family protein [Campylobacter canadensis]MBZ8002944.1 Fic family protein [Campylobacter canadensis]